VHAHAYARYDHAYGRDDCDHGDRGYVHGYYVFQALHMNGLNNILYFFGPDLHLVSQETENLVL